MHKTGSDIDLKMFGRRPSQLLHVPDQPRSRTSDVLFSLADRAFSVDVSLRDLTERLGDRTFGMLLMLVAIFSIVPLVSLIAGLLVASLGVQMALGMRHPWIPERILDRRLPASHVRNALLTFAPRVRSMERFIRPRWQFSEAPIVDRINGIVITLLGCIIMLPLPFTNLPPAFIVIVMGVGLMERDGLIQASAALIGVIAITLVVGLIPNFAGQP